MLQYLKTLLILTFMVKIKNSTLTSAHHPSLLQHQRAKMLALSEYEKFLKVETKL